MAATGAVAFSISLKWKIFCKYFRVFLVFCYFFLFLFLVFCCVVFSLISFRLLWLCLRSCYFCKAVSLFFRAFPLASPGGLFCFVFLQIFCVIFKADNDDSQRRWRHFVSHPEDFQGRLGTGSWGSARVGGGQCQSI